MLPGRTSSRIPGRGGQGLGGWDVVGLKGGTYVESIFCENLCRSAGDAGNVYQRGYRCGSAGRGLTS